MTFSVIHFFLYIHSRWNFFFFNISGRNNSKISRNIKKNDTSNFFHQYELHKMSLKIEEIHIISFTFFFFENKKVGNTDFSKNLKKNYKWDWRRRKNKKNSTRFVNRHPLANFSEEYF